MQKMWYNVSQYSFLKEWEALNGKLRKALKIAIFTTLLLVISCNANMDTNDKNKALNEYKLKIFQKSLRTAYSLNQTLN